QTINLGGQKESVEVISPVCGLTHRRSRQYLNLQLGAAVKPAPPPIVSQFGRRRYCARSDELGAAVLVLPLSIHEVKPATSRKSMSAIVPTANLCSRRRHRSLSIICSSGKLLPR